MNQIIGISGCGGAGKTTLVNELAKYFKATAIFWDDFDSISKDPDDYLAWYESGQDYSMFDYVELGNALNQLKNDNAYQNDAINLNLSPTKIIIADLPLGRPHQQTSKYVDTFVFIDTPLDIALCRRLIRDSEQSNQDIKVQLTEYLKFRKLYLMSEAKTSAEIMVDGNLAREDIAQLVIEKLSTKGIK